MLDLYYNYLPADMKYGTRNIPERTLARSTFKVFPSNGREPQTNTYNTTPKLCKNTIYHQLKQLFFKRLINYIFIVHFIFIKK